MLYNDDYEEVNNSSFLPVYKDIAKTKKISIATFLLIVISIIVIFNVIYTITLDKNSKETAELAQSLYENKVEEEIVVKEEPEEIVAVETKSNIDERPLLASHDINLIRSKFLPKQLEMPQETIKNLYFSEEKQVFLTFDDGPTSNITPQILDILKNEGVPATFFILGARAEQNPGLVKRAYDEGHYIANHGYSHSYKTIYASIETVWGEYAHTEQVIRNCIGIQEYNSFLFRFPGGSSGGKYASIKSKAKEYFESQKVATVNWNALSGDAEGAETREEQIEYIQNTSTDNTLIVLMHDAYDKQVTADVLPEIIKYYRDQGYVFKNFYEIF